MPWVGAMLGNPGGCCISIGNHSACSYLVLNEDNHLRQLFPNLSCLFISLFVPTFQINRPWLSCAKEPNCRVC